MDEKEIQFKIEKLREVFRISLQGLWLRKKEVFDLFRKKIEQEKVKELHKTLLDNHIKK